MYGLGTAIRAALFGLLSTTAASAPIASPLEADDGPSRRAEPTDESALPQASKDLPAGPPAIAWLPDVRRCYRSPRPYCNGPRRTPVPHGPEAELAQQLGLGTIQVAQQLLGRRPDSAWVAAAGTAKDETLLWPVEGGNHMRGFGFVRRNRPDLQHDGVDVTAPIGTPVRAANGGIVAYSDNEVHGYGNLLMIVHPDGTTTIYAHLRSSFVFPGQHVARGQTVGEIGVTGLSQGPHLHFEWHRNGRAANPARLFAERPTGWAPFPNFTGLEGHDHDHEHDDAAEEVLALADVSVAE